jgi:hypothetical protein
MNNEPTPQPELTPDVPTTTPNLCAVCDKSFDTPQGLWLHKARAHGALQGSTWPDRHVAKTEEERAAAKREYQRQYRIAHAEKRNEYDRTRRAKKKPSYPPSEGKIAYTAARLRRMEKDRERKKIVRHKAAENIPAPIAVPETLCFCPRCGINLEELRSKLRS